MRKLLALVEREYLEHRGAFLYAPAIILAVLTVILVMSVATDRFRVIHGFAALPVRKLFELGFLAIGAMWAAYLLVALFFYFADAFSADRRNNAMLFWKSMPVSDFTVLGSKMLAGMTVLPALIYAALLLTGVLLFAAVMVGLGMITGIVRPTPMALIESGVQVAIFAPVTVLLGLLWYAPFFAWVGLLSTIVGRWSIPLAFLIPGMVGLFEKLLFPKLTIDSVVLTWLGNRLQFGPQGDSFVSQLVMAPRFEAVPALASLVAFIDWTQVAGGLAVAAILVYAASEYRRRLVSS